MPIFVESSATDDGSRRERVEIEGRRADERWDRSRGGGAPVERHEGQGMPVWLDAVVVSGVDIR